MQGKSPGNGSPETKSRPLLELVELVDKAAKFAFSGARDSIKAVRLASFSAQRFVEGSLAPAMSAVVDVNQGLTTSALSVLRGEKKAVDGLRETAGRAKSGARFAKLVRTLGKELYGSAKFAGETILAEDEAYRLTYIPPREGVPVQELALFHVAGAIPYGDRLFRMLPEANLYEPFLARGVPVYAMELRGDRFQVNYAAVTLDSLVDSIERLSTVAFEHRGGKKLILEGYCGHGMQAMAYVAAKPEDAERKFAAIALFVSPIDGRECADLGEVMSMTPDALLKTNFVAYRVLLGGYVPGDATRMGLDLTLRTLFYKTRFGYFMAGWNQDAYANVKGMSDLDPAQRLHLAGAYWISPDNANRFPLPVGLVGLAKELFTKGIAPNGDIPGEYKGETLRFHDVAEKTTMPIIGFYGGIDRVVPDKTAYILQAIFGERYTHVVHPNAGHISYVLAPKLWEAGFARGLKPNPLELIASKIQAKS